MALLAFLIIVFGGFTELSTCLITSTALRISVCKASPSAIRSEPPTTTTTTLSPTTTSTTVTTTTPHICPPEGVWSEWETVGECATTCGSASTAKRTRHCTDKCGECPCFGEPDDIGPCGTAMCKFPSVSCFPPYLKTINGNGGYYFCGPGGVTPTTTCEVPTTNTTTTSTPSTTTQPPKTTTTTPPITTTQQTTTTQAITTTIVPRTCPPEGVWSEWMTTGACATTCGSASTAQRKRICTSKCGECPCIGEEVNIGPCGIDICPYPQQTCYPPYLKTETADGYYFCGPGGKLPKTTCQVPNITTTSTPSTTTTPIEKTTTTTIPITTTKVPSICPPDGVWSEWITTGGCGTTCGSYNTAIRIRNCTNECGDCPCTGEDWNYGPCGISLCPDPGNECSYPYIRTLNYKTNSFFCGPGGTISKTTCEVPTNNITTTSTPSTTTQPPITTTTTTPQITTTTVPSSCPPGGVWSEWAISAGTCTTNCGSYSTIPRYRNCTNKCGDCPCIGSDKGYGRCGIDLCPFPEAECHQDFKKTFNANTNKYFCGDGIDIPRTTCQGQTDVTTTTISPPTTTTTPETITTQVPSTCPPDGVWSEWGYLGDCFTTCGAYSTQPRNRTCSTKCGNCPCTGVSEDYGPCGVALCPFPQATCNQGFIKTFNADTNSYYCGKGITQNTTCRAP